MPVIFANVKIISAIKKTFESTAAIHGIDTLEQIVIGKINVFNVWREHLELNYGTNDDALGKYAIKSFVSATKALKEGKVDVLSKVSNLMIWSDNDVANDFTTLKTPTGEQV